MKAIIKRILKILLLPLASITILLQFIIGVVIWLPMYILTGKDIIDWMDYVLLESWSLYLIYEFYED